MVMTARPSSSTSIVDQITSYPVPKEVIRPYAAEHDLTELVVEEHARELLRYLAMTLSDPAAGYAMCDGPADHFWHFWLDQPSWVDFGENYGRRVVGRAILHVPSSPQHKARVRDGLEPNGYQRFLDDYQGYFGHQAPADIWPRCEHDGAGVECNDRCAGIQCSDQGGGKITG